MLKISFGAVALLLAAAPPHSPVYAQSAAPQGETAQKAGISSVPAAKPGGLDANAAGPDGVPADLVQRITRAYAALSSYRCSFATYMDGNAKPELTGDLFFVRPDLLRASVKRRNQTRFVAIDASSIYRQRER